MKRRATALIGCLALGVIALGLLRHSLTLPEAATRAAVLLVVLSIVDGLLVPLAAAALEGPKRRADDEVGEPGRNG